MSIVYLNGEFLPVAEAHVSVLDRGFIFGDGVYEVVPVYDARARGLDKHLARLKASLEAVKIRLELDEHTWNERINTLVAKNGGGDQSVYIQVTRGVQEVRDHSFNQPFKPTVFMMASAIRGPGELVKTGVRAITLDDNRWSRCHIKSTSLQPNVLLKQKAIERGAMEAILIRDGLVTEGAASNVFVLTKSAELFTAPKEMNILAGVTRDLVVSLALENGFKLKEQALPAEQLSSAEEIWITSSSKEILPVVILDDRPVNNGVVGSAYRRIMQAYQQYKQQLMVNDAYE